MIRPKDNPTDALFEADDATVDRIAAICPADWDDEAVFRHAYQKYQGKETASLRRFRRFDVMRFAVTAACLLVMCGGIGGLYALHQLAPEPESPIIHEQLPTETTPAPSIDSTTAITTESTHAATSVPASTTSLQAVTTVVTQTAPVTAETAAASAETAVSSAAATDAPAIQTVPVQTIPAETETTAAETTQLPTEPTTETPTETIPETEPVYVGFVEEHDGSTYQFRYDGAEPIPLDDGSYVLDLEDCTIKENETSERFRRFSISQTPDGVWYHSYTIDHFPYEDFRYSCRVSGTEVQQVAVGAGTGYLISAGSYSVLFWDDGTGVSLISSDRQYSSELLRIAAAFHQA